MNKGTIIANQSTPLIIGSAIKNAGAMEANGGTLEVLGAVTGAGQFTIGDPSTLEFDSSVSSDQTIDMTGVGSTLILEDPLSFAADIVGFKDDDTIDFGTTAFTGVASITMFKAYKATLNKIVGGFAVEDQASALQADLLGLAADKSHINSIVAQNGLVTTNLATFKADKATLNKVVGGFAISATAANISANLNLLQSDVADISSIALTNPSSPTPVLKISKAQASADAGILAKVDSPYVLQIDHSKSKIITGYGDDLTIDVGGGDSTVTGGGSNETFLFGSNFKQATISDFATHASDGLHDTISLPAQDFTDWAALLGDAHASGTGGANTTFTAQDGASLTLLDVTLAQFQQTGAALQNDFTFHA